MLNKRVDSILFATLLTSLVCLGQEKAPSKLILKVDETVSGPFGGQKASSCLRVYSDGKVHFASRRNSAISIVDEKTGQESRPEHTISVEHRLEQTDEWELSHFLKSKPLKRLPEEFAPPHTPIDYVESILVEIIGPSGKSKRISTREFYMASLEEKIRYPSALIVLMGKIDDIEHEASDKGKPTDMLPDCQLKAEQH